MTLLLLGTLMWAFTIQPARANGDIYIRPDGTVEGTDKIHQDEDVYTFTDNIHDTQGIVVERDNIVIDGAGYTMSSWWGGTGIDLSNRHNVTIKNTALHSFTYGIDLDWSLNNTISGNTITNTDWFGIYLFRSSHNTLSRNTITNNLLNGIFLTDDSNNNNITGNTVTNQPLGIGLDEYSDYNTISGNNLTENYETGLVLTYGSNYNNVLGNSITQNNGWGIHVHDCSNSTISGNVVTNNQVGIDLGGSNNTLRNNDASSNKHNLVIHGSYSSQDIDDSNSVDGKPVYYWVNRRDMAVPLDAGYVALINCTNMTVKNLNLTNNGEGILVYSTTDSLITGNNMTNNECGIDLSWGSDYNTVSGNNIVKNEYGIRLRDSNNDVSENNIVSNNYGIRLPYCSNNSIYHNNFINNTLQVNLLAHLTSIDWDDGYPSGGNYWSDYEDRYPDATEIDDSGIWDTPYVIDESNQDDYPLMEPWILPLPVSTTIDELRAEIEDLGSQGEIDNQGIVRALVTKLNVAQKLVDKGKIDEAKSILNDDFIPQVQNLSGIHISIEAVAILVESAEHIIAHL